MPNDIKFVYKSSSVKEPNMTQTLQTIPRSWNLVSAQYVHEENGLLVAHMIFEVPPPRRPVTSEFVELS